MNREKGVDLENLLVVLTPDAPLQKVEDKIAEWVGEEKKRKRIILLMVVEEDLPSSVSSWLMYVGFLGGKLESEMKKAIIEELMIRGREILEDQKKKLRELGVSFILREDFGGVREIIKGAIEEFSPSEVIVTGFEREKLEDLNVEVL